MNLQALLPIAFFLAMGVVVVAATWRIFVVGGEARRLAQTMRLASDVAHRADACLSDLAATLDELRRGRLDQESAAQATTLGLEKMRGVAEEGRTCAARTDSAAVAALSAELDRAVRSLELIEHGRELQVSYGGNPGEGETSVKRGYLSLLHAREAIRERGNEIRREGDLPSVLRAPNHR